MAATYIKLKDGVNFNGLHRMMIFALNTIIPYWPEAFLTITSGLDGQHKKNSLHASGKAIDIRTKDFPKTTDINDLRNLLQSALGNAYDVVRESDHIHIEYDPK